MKRVFALFLVLLISTAALAEGVTPSALLASRGYVVWDESQLASMGLGEMPGYMSSMDYAMCVKSGEQPPSLAFSHDGVLYVAFDGASMAGNQPADLKDVSDVFIDLCRSTDFAMYAFGSTEQMLVFGDFAAFEAAATEEGENVYDGLADKSVFSEPYTSKDEFITAIQEMVE